MTDFAFDRKPDPAWIQRLNELTPTSDRLSYLSIRWHPGFFKPARFFGGRKIAQERWIPVERWLIYQVNPKPRTYPFPLWNGLPMVGYRRVHSRPIVDLNRRAFDRVNWEIYLETGHYAQPFFVIQGDRGGHKRNYTEVEQKLSRLNGGTGEPAGLGELAYAEPDERTWEKIGAYDRARFWNRAIALDERTPEMFDDQERQEIQGFRRKLLDWMDEKAYSVTSGVSDMNTWRGAIAASGVSTPAGYKDTFDYEKSEREFIEEPA